MKRLLGIMICCLLAPTLMGSIKKKAMKAAKKTALKTYEDYKQQELNKARNILWKAQAAHRRGAEEAQARLQKRLRIAKKAEKLYQEYATKMAEATNKDKTALTKKYQAKILVVDPGLQKLDLPWRLLPTASERREAFVNALLKFKAEDGKRKLRSYSPGERFRLILDIVGHKNAGMLDRKRGLDIRTQSEENIKRQAPIQFLV